jgi:hypothetical protein
MQTAIFTAEPRWGLMLREVSGARWLCQSAAATEWPRRRRHIT